MNKIRKTLVVVFSALFVLCTAMFAAGCTLNLNNSKAPVDAETPDTSKNAYTVSVDVNDPSLGYYTLSEKNCGDGYEEGSLVTFTVKPNEDYEARLSINGEEVELQGDSYTFAVSEDVQASVEYIYKYEIYTYVLEGEGTIRLSDRHEDGKFHAGDNVTVTVTPSAGYELNEVLINGEPKEMTPSEEGGFTYTIENLSGRTYVVAKFGALHTVTLAQENEIDNEEAKGEVTLAAGETPIVSGETLLSEGTEVTLTVKPKEGETFSVYVDGYYQIPTDGGNGAKTVTFTVKADTVVKVVWDIYYTVSIEHANSDVTVYLQNYTTDQRRFLAGTEIDFTVKAADGYEVVSVMAGDQLLTPVSGIYTLTVNDNVTIVVVSESHGCNVSVSLSNSSYGEAGLSIIEGSSNEDGTYAYDSKLTLTATPNAGYKLNYVTVNGTRVKMTGPDDDGAYTCEVTVTADTKIYVAFGKTERYNVRVSFYSLTALAIDPELNGNKKALPNDVYITASCYEGQEYAFDLNLDESNAFSEGVTLYYSLDGAEPVLWEKSESGYVLEGKVGTENISYILTCELPALKAPDLSVEAGSMVGSDRIDAADYVEAQILNGEYVYTFLADPSPELCPFTTATASYEFKGWIVTVNGKLWTDAPAVAAIAALAEDPDPYLFHEGDWFNIAYSADVAVTIEAKWEQVGYVLNLVVNNLPEEMKVNVSVYRKTYTDSGELYPVREKNILQITESNTYTIKVSDVDLLFYVEIELRDHMRVTVIDPLYTNDKGGNDFVMDGVAGGANSEQIDPDIWPNEEKILMWGSPDTIKVGTEFELTVIYTKLYSVFVNGEEQSDLVADGENYTLPAAVGEAPKAVDFGTWEYHWYKEGDYSTYYAPEAVLEAVHGELRFAGEWVVPVTYILQYEVKGGPAPDDKPAEGTFFKVYARGLELNVGDNTVYYINAEKQETLSYAFNIPEGWRAVVEYWRTDNSGEFNDLSVRERYYDSNDSEQGRPTYSKAKVLLKVTYLKIYDLTITGDENVTVAYGENQKMDFGYDAGSVVDLTITAKTGYLNVQVSANIPEYLTHDEGTDVWHVTLNADITLTITAEKQPVSFPDPDEGTEETSGAPVQGEWQSASEESPSTLSFTEDSVTVNGEEVERIGYEGEGGEIVYTLETETKTYTLEWYGKVAGYILALTDTTTSGASPVALFAAEAPANVTYFVSPAYGERYCDAFKGGDAAKLVGEWTAEGQILTFSELEGQAQVSLDGNSAKYLFAVAEGHYLMVIGTTAYDMILEGYVLNVNGVAFHTQYQVTVTEDGDKADGCSYTLKNADADVGSDSKVAAGTVLTLTVNAPKGYTVSVVITGGSYETQDNTYTITVSTGVTIAITYTAPSVDTVTGAALGSATLVLDIDTTGYAEDDTLLLQSILKLRLGEKEIAPAEVTFASEGKFKATFSLSGVEAGSYAVTLTANGENVPFNDGLSANTVVEKTTYDLQKQGDAYQLTVTVKVEYTITVNETPADGCSYELKKGEERLELLDNKATVEENTVLTLTVNAPKGYTVSVTITGGSYETQGNTYTITVSGDVTIAITYTAPSVDTVTGALFDPAILVLDIDATGYTAEDLSLLQSILLLHLNSDAKEIAPYSVIVNGSAPHFRAYFHLNDVAAGSYAVTLTANGENVPFNDGIDINKEHEGTIYEFKQEDGVYKLTVTVKPQITEFYNGEIPSGSSILQFYIKYKGIATEDLAVGKVQLVAGTITIALNAASPAGDAMLLQFDLSTAAVSSVLEATSLQLKIGENSFDLNNIINGNWNGSYTHNGYVFTLSLENKTAKLTVTKAQVFYTVTVNETGEKGESTYTLTKDGAPLEWADNKATVEENTKLTLTLNLTEGYTAEVKVSGGSETHEGNTYTITVSANTEITITYTAPVVEKKVTGVESVHLSGALLVFIVTTEGGYTFDELKGTVKLIHGGSEYEAIGGGAYGAEAGKFELHYNQVVNFETGTEAISLKVGEDQEIDKIPVGNPDSAQEGTKTFKLEQTEDGKCNLVIAETPTEYTVTVTENPEEGGSYELKNGDVTISSGDKVEAGTKLTLTVTPAADYTAEVKVNNADVQPDGGKGNTYTITVTAETTITITYTKNEVEPPEVKEYNISELTDHPGDKVNYTVLHFADSQAYDYLKTNATRADVEDTEGHKKESCWFEIVGTAYVNFMIGAEVNRTNFTIKWYNKDGQQIAVSVYHGVEAPTEYTVTVNQVGNVEGCGYTLKSGDQEVQNEGKVPANATLTLVVTPAEGYTAEVKVTGGTLNTTSANNYTITDLKSEVVITITYQKAGEESAKKVTGVESVHLSGALLVFIVTTEGGYTFDELKGTVKLIHGGSEYEAIGGGAYGAEAGKFELHYNQVAGFTTGTEVISLKVGENQVIDQIPVGSPDSAQEGTKTFKLEAAGDGKCNLVITAEAAEKKIYGFHNGQIFFEDNITKIDFYAFFEGYGQEDLEAINAAQLVIKDGYILTNIFENGAVTSGALRFQFNLQLLDLSGADDTLMGEYTLSFKVGDKTVEMAIDRGAAWSGTYSSGKFTFTLSGQNGENAKMNVGIRQINPLKENSKYREPFFLDLYFGQDDAEYLKNAKHARVYNESEKVDKVIENINLDGGNHIGLDVGETIYIDLSIEWLDSNKNRIATSNYIITSVAVKYTEGGATENNKVAEIVNVTDGIAKPESEIILKFLLEDNWNVTLKFNDELVTFDQITNKQYTYQVHKRPVNIVVLFKQNDVKIEPKTLNTDANHPQGSLDTFEENLLHLYLEDFSWLSNPANAVDHVWVDSRKESYSYSNNKGYQLDGYRVTVYYPDIQYTLPEEITLHWMNMVNDEVATTVVKFTQKRTFTDASLIEEGEKVYFVISGTYVGYTKEQIEESFPSSYDFQPNGYYSGGYESKGTQTPEREIVMTDDTFKIKFDITAMPSYGYNFHFGGDWYGLSKDASIHGKTLTYKGRIYTLYNFGRDSNRGDPTFWWLLGLTIWEEKLISWDNKGLTNNYTLNQGDTITLSAAIASTDDVNNWGIVALLKLNGQDGILIAPDKVSSYIGKQTADVSGSVQIGETNYTVTSTPGENLDNAKASDAIVTIMIEYTDSAISVTYTILNAEQANYTFSVTIDGVSGGSCVVGFAQSGGTNASLSVSTR